MHSSSHSSQSWPLFLVKLHHRYYLTDALMLFQFLKIKLRPQRSDMCSWNAATLLLQHVSVCSDTGVTSKPQRMVSHVEQRPAFRSTLKSCGIFWESSFYFEMLLRTYKPSNYAKGKEIVCICFHVTQKEE